jgi:hypothetical protein
MQRPRHRTSIDVGRVGFVATGPQHASDVPQALRASLLAKHSSNALADDFDARVGGMHHGSTTRLRPRRRVHATGAALGFDLARQLKVLGVIRSRIKPLER